MHRAVLPITLTVVALAAFGWGFWLLFEGQRNDAATARDFLSQIADGNLAEAGALMTPALAAQVASSNLDVRLGALEAWDRISFAQRSTEGLSEARETELWGSGTTDSGCRSELHIRVVNGLVDEFRIDPLCPRAGTDT